MSKKINVLFLTFFFTPDLSAGSFRNTNLFGVLKDMLPEGSHIHVITTTPNRYNSFSSDLSTELEENGKGFTINRVQLSPNKGGYLDQMKSFYRYYREVVRLSKNRSYDLVYASSSRLFTAYLGSKISKKKNIPLYLDIRDIFVDTILDVFGKKIIYRPFLKAFKIIEKKTFTRAKHINLVSQGFKTYFEKYSQASFSFFTNGIDDVFLKNGISNHLHNDNSVKRITYAGNIGAGQGLEKIIPFLGLGLGRGYIIQVIGDGNTKKLLQDKLQQLNVTNVKLIAPVKREKLIEYYKNSDYLFLHLNNLKAFEKVLPSKLFEYGAFNIPIIAGVSGYAAEFINRELNNSIVFEPTNSKELIDKLKNIDYKLEERSEFKINYSRVNILRNMSTSIIEIKS